MSLQFFFNVFHNRRPHFLMLITILTIGIEPVLGQEGQGLSMQPVIAARSAVLMNPATGEILFAKEPRLRLPPASTTKVLTALVVLERLDPNTRLPVSPQAASASPSRIGLRAGEAATTQDLLYGLLLKSGNDAAETLAEGAGGSIYGFSELMNAKAEQIGAHDSHFMNPHGLPNDEHYTTAYDLALIFRQAMNHPMFVDIVRTRSAALRIESWRSSFDDWRMVPVLNHNRLLVSYEGARGGKTGFTLKARRCFVGEVERGGIRLIVAILNSPNSGTLWQDARVLLDYGFTHYGLAPLPPMQSETLPVLVQETSATTPVRAAAKLQIAKPATLFAHIKVTLRKNVIARKTVATTKLAVPRIGRSHAVAVTQSMASGKAAAKAKRRVVTRIARADSVMKLPQRMVKSRTN